MCWRHPGVEPSVTQTITELLDSLTILSLVVVSRVVEPRGGSTYMIMGSLIPSPHPGIMRHSTSSNRIWFFILLIFGFVLMTGIEPATYGFENPLALPFELHQRAKIWNKFLSLY